MTAGAILVPSIIPLRSPMVGQMKNIIDTETLIEMRSETPNTKVYYTTNGLKPSPFESYSPEAKATYLFEQPITLPSGKKTIKALAVAKGSNRMSSIVTKVFEVEPNANEETNLLIPYDKDGDLDFINHIPTNNEMRLRAKQVANSMVMGRNAWGDGDEARVQFNKTLPNNKFAEKTRELALNQPRSLIENDQFVRLQRETDYLKCPYCLAPRPASDPFSKFCNQCGSPVTPLMQNNPSKNSAPNLMDQVGKCPSCKSIVPFNTDQCIICEGYLRNKPSTVQPALRHSSSFQTPPSLCPSCGTANPPQSKICFVCTSVLPAPTSSLMASINNMMVSNDNTNDFNLVKLCHKCGRNNNSNARFCDWCRSKPVQCSKCYTVNHPHSQHCSNCGSQLPPPSQQFQTDSFKPPLKPVVTSDVSTQTVGLYYPSANKVRTLENLLSQKKENYKGWSSQKGVVLSALSPGRGYWRKQIDHICAHLKAHASNDINFRSLISQPRMGKLLQATVNEDGYELSLTLNFAVRLTDGVLEVRRTNGELKESSRTFGDYFEDVNADEDISDEDQDDPEIFSRPYHTSNALMKRDNGKEKSNKGALNELNKALIKEVGKFGKGRATKVQELIDEGADARACSNRNGLTLLHMAATCNHYEVIPVLVQAGIDINSADNKGNTALHETVKLNDPETEKVVENLLGCGADPNKKNKFSESAFDIATKLGYQNLSDKMAVFVGQISLNKMARHRKIVDDY